MILSITIAIIGALLIWIAIKFNSEKCFLTGFMMVSVGTIASLILSALNGGIS